MKSTLINNVSATGNNSAISLNEESVPGTKKLYSFLIMLAPILNQYQILPLTYLEIVAVLGTALLILKKQRIIRLEKYAQFSIVGFFTSIIAFAINFFYINSFDVGIGTITIRMIKYIFLFFGFVIAGKEFFDTTYAKRIYRILIAVTVVAFFVQYLAFLISGRNLYFIIPNLTLNYNEGVNSSEFVRTTISDISAGYFYRPSSFFLEPAHFSLFVVPWLALELFDEESPKYLGVILVSASVLLSTSSLGFVGVLIVWSIYAFHYAKQMKKDYRKWIALPFFIVFLYFVINYIANDSGFITSVNIKLKSITKLSAGSSLTVRLFRGALYYNEIGFLQKVFGVGYGNLSAYYDAVHMFIIYDANVTEKAYMSGLFTILNSFGIIGLLMYIRWMVSVWKSRDICTRVLLVLLVAFLLTSSCFEAASYWIMIFFLLILKT